MQNNKLKLNTVLLVILLILAIGIIWIQWHDRKAEEGRDAYIKSQTVIEKEEEDIKPAPSQPVSPKQDPKIVILKSFFAKHSGLAMITECSYNSSTYYSVRLDATGDAGNAIYDSNGNQVTTGGGFTSGGTQFSQEYKNISPTCTKIIYRSSLIGGSEVDVYNLR